MRILNLYAGIGGNRKLWPVTEQDEVVAVEIDPEIAAIYQSFFPNDKVIVADAHQYLLEHYQEFDFIWSSPPCPTHSRIRLYSAVARGQNKPLYPDMSLYQEIIFLQYHFKGKWCVENVNSYYDPLIKPYVVGDHFYWSNFYITPKEGEAREHNSVLEVLQVRKGFDLSGLKCSKEKKLLLRNCVEPEFGLHIWNCAFKEKQINLVEVLDGKE